jgi:hypothetical protein
MYIYRLAPHNRSIYIHFLPLILLPSSLPPSPSSLPPLPQSHLLNPPPPLRPLPFYLLYSARLYLLLSLLVYSLHFTNRLFFQPVPPLFPSTFFLFLSSFSCPLPPYLSPCPQTLAIFFLFPYTVAPLLTPFFSPFSPSLVLSSFPFLPLFHSFLLLSLPSSFFTSSPSLPFLFPFPPLFSLLPHCFLSCFSLSPHFPNSIPLSTSSNSPIVLSPLVFTTLQRHCTENSKHKFQEMKQRGLVPNFHIYVSVGDLYNPAIGLPILPHESRAVSFLGMHKSNII